MTDKHQITIQNELEQLPQAMQLLEELSEQWQLDMKVSMNLALSLEEALSNVIFYAYPKGENGIIEVTMEREANQVSLTIEDKGMAFNPLTDAKTPDTEANVEDRQVGGLGIHFIKSLMDKVSYQRMNNKNQLEFSKRI